MGLERIRSVRKGPKVDLERIRSVRKVPEVLKSNGKLPQKLSSLCSERDLQRTKRKDIAFKKLKIWRRIMEPTKEGYQKIREGLKRRKME